VRREQRPITRIRQEIKWPCRERIVERGARLIGRTCGNACRDRRTEKEHDHAPVHGLSHVAPRCPSARRPMPPTEAGSGSGRCVVSNRKSRAEWRKIDVMRLRCAMKTAVRTPLGRCRHVCAFSNRGPASAAGRPPRRPTTPAARSFVWRREPGLRNNGLRPVLRVLGRQEPRDFAARRPFEAKERLDGFARRARIHEVTIRLPPFPGGDSGGQLARSGPDGDT
jgi:hypothetical protein